ncbi:hypothetical protein AAVH_00264 [Aphelenchoides avenae]|nr:hypothetical protein AAVH_00264 [Aphelenchus avenae]
MLRDRELTGKGSSIAHLVHRTKLRNLRIRQRAGADSIANKQNAIFLGLSHDSGLIAELVVRPAEVSETNYNDDDVFEPDVQWVLNHLSTDLGRRSENGLIYASFSADSTVLSCVYIRDWISDSTVDVTLDFVLLPHQLSISMKAYTFLGSRDSYKPYNVFLRSCGRWFVLNTGDSMLTLHFSNECPPPSSNYCSTFRVEKVSTDDVSPPTQCSGAVVSDICVQDSRYRETDCSRTSYRMLPQTDGSTSDAVLFVTEYVLDVPKLMRLFVRRVSEKFYPNYKAVPIDIHTTVLGINDESVVHMLVGAVAELSYARHIFVRIMCEMEWDLKKRTHAIKFRSCNEITFHDTKFRRWYPVDVPCDYAFHEFTMSNEPALEAESLTLLNTYFPGIELCT